MPHPTPGSLRGVLALAALAVASGAEAVSFRQAPRYIVGGSAAASALADFDGDARMDLAVVDGISVSVLRGDGTGAFAPPVSFPAGPNPRAVASADFNGDGKRDLAIAGSGGVAVLLGDGALGFGSPVLYPTGGTDVAVGDFNEDGRPDIASCGGATLYIRQGDGAGGFGTPLPLSLGLGSSRALFAADLGNGHLDIVVTSEFGVGVAVGSGAGGFAPVVGYALSWPRINTALADVNGDSKPDLVVGGGFSEPFIEFVPAMVLLGDGAGGFGSAYPIPVYGSYHWLAAADFDGDSSPDLADWGYGGVVLRQGDGAGGFGAWQLFEGGEDTPSSTIITGDVNADGRMDVVVSSGVVVILLGDGALGFPGAMGMVYPVADTKSAPDMNNDGVPDLIALSYDGVIVLLGDGTGQFSLNLAPGSGIQPRSVAAGDLNGDGKADLAVSYFDRVSAFLGDGAGGLGPPTSVPRWPSSHRPASASTRRCSTGRGSRLGAGRSYLGPFPHPVLQDQPRERDFDILSY